MSDCSRQRGRSARRSLFTEQILAELTSPIAVVGNARLALKYGKLIDTYPTIIRFNAFLINGYQAFCGSRTTHWCTFGDTTTNPRLPQHRGDGLEPFSPFTLIAPESMNIKPNFARRMVFAAKSRGRRLFPRPSTGFALLLILEELGHSADIFGFDGFRTGHYYDLSHRHDPVHSSNEFDYLRKRPAFHVFSDFT